MTAELIASLFGFFLIRGIIVHQWLLQVSQLAIVNRQSAIGNRLALAIRSETVQFKFRWTILSSLVYIAASTNFPNATA